MCQTAGQSCHPEYCLSGQKYYPSVCLSGFLPYVSGRYEKFLNKITTILCHCCLGMYAFSGYYNRSHFQSGQDKWPCCGEFVQNTKAPPTTGAVLGKDVMEAIWADMTPTELPSWVSEASYNWGTMEQGKLSTDNWRVICTVHLPITLIRL